MIDRHPSSASRHSRRRRPAGSLLALAVLPVFVLPVFVLPVFVLLLALLGLIGAPAPAGAQEAAGDQEAGATAEDSSTEEPAAEEPDDWAVEWSNGFKFTSPDGTTKLTIGGRAMIDWAVFSGDDAVEAVVGPLEEGTELRRGRLFVSGTFADRIEFKAQYEFADGAEARDLYLGLIHLPGIGGVRVGHFFEPFSLEQLTSSKYITLMERATVVEAFAPARNAGFMIGQGGAGGDRMTWHLGVFKDVDEFGDRLADEWNVTGRLTGLPYWRDGGRHLFHLGASLSERSPNDDRVRFRSRPEAHLAPRFVDTGFLAADGVTLLGLEAAWVGGPWSVQGEWMQADVDTLAGPDPSFEGSYVTVSRVLTGEHRPYSRSSGKFGRLKPRRDIRAGLGAWEIAARWSTLDLSDAGVTGGELDDLTLGVNAYLLSNVRASLNLVQADLDGVGEVEVVEMRFQVDF